MEIKELYNEMRSTWDDFKEANDQRDAEIKANGEATQETKNLVDSLNNRITELQGEMKGLQTAANRPPMGGSGAAARNAKLSAEELEKKEQQNSVFMKYLRFGLSKGAWQPEEQKALSDLIDDQGGYLVPPDFANEMIEVAQYMAEVRTVARTQTTSRNEVEYSKLTQRAQIAWGNENIAVSPQDLALGLEAIPVNELTALVLVPNTLLEDAESNVWGDLTDIFGTDTAWAEDEQFAVGNGNKRPEGFAANKDVQARAINSGAAADLTNSDVLLDALYSLKKIYRKNATWAMNTQTEGIVRKMKDNYGQYLWAPGLEPGRPSALLGQPVINPQGLPDVAANTFPIVVGDFRRGYKVVDRRGLRIQRLVERYAEYRQTGFLVTKRVGGGVVLTEALTPIKISA